MHISVNGESRDFALSTLAELLEDFDIDPGRVAVEVNLKVIRKAEYGNFFLKEGDVIEIVNFVGGG